MNANECFYILMTSDDSSPQICLRFQHISYGRCVVAVLRVLNAFQPLFGDRYDVDQHGSMLSINLAIQEQQPYPAYQLKDLKVPNNCSLAVDLYDLS